MCLYILLVTTLGTWLQSFGCNFSKACLQASLTTSVQKLLWVGLTKAGSLKKYPHTTSLISLLMERKPNLHKGPKFLPLSRQVRICTKRVCAMSLLECENKQYFRRDYLCTELGVYLFGARQYHVVLCIYQLWNWRHYSHITVELCPLGQLFLLRTKAFRHNYNAFRDHLGKVQSSLSHSLFLSLKIPQFVFWCATNQLHRCFNGDGACSLSSRSQSEPALILPTISESCSERYLPASQS